MANTFRVIQSNPSNEGKSFVTKLVRETTVNHPVFGNKVKKETYYISGSNQIAKDTEITEDQLFPAFKVVEHPMVNPNTGETFMGKWLHLA